MGVCCFSFDFLVNKDFGEFSSRTSVRVDLSMYKYKCEEHVQEEFR